jgi:hypothetical protein
MRKEGGGGARILSTSEVRKLDSIFWFFAFFLILPAEIQAINNEREAKCIFVPILFWLYNRGLE